MKTGKSLQALVVELERQATTKKDFIADTRKLSFEAEPEHGVVLNGVNGPLPLQVTAHQQLGLSLGIPKVYYDRLLQNAPDLLAKNANHWLQAEPAKKMVRTLDGKVRAVLSNSFRPLDNLDLASAVLPKLVKLKATVQSSEVTENRFYLKAVTDRIQGEVKVGDVVQAGMVVSNSETGLGALHVEALDFWLSCLNGMIREGSIRKTHVGRRNHRDDALEEAREFYRDETRRLEDRTFFAKVQDAVTGMFDQGRFNKRIDQYRDASKRMIEAPADEVLEVTAKKLLLTDEEQSSVLKYLIQGGDLSQYGLSNAITRASQDVDSYDRATDMEKMGGTIVELSPSEWKAIAA